MRVWVKFCFTGRLHKFETVYCMSTQLRIHVHVAMLHRWDIQDLKLLPSLPPPSFPFPLPAVLATHWSFQTAFPCSGSIFPWHRQRLYQDQHWSWSLLLSCRHAIRAAGPPREMRIWPITSGSSSTCWGFFSRPQVTHWLASFKTAWWHWSFWQR